MNWLIIVVNISACITYKDAASISNIGVATWGWWHVWCLVATFVRGDMVKQATIMKKLIIRECMPVAGKWVTKKEECSLACLHVKQGLSVTHIYHTINHVLIIVAQFFSWPWTIMLSIPTVLVFMLAMTAISSWSSFQSKTTFLFKEVGIPAQFNDACHEFIKLLVPCQDC